MQADDLAQRRHRALQITARMLGIGAQPEKLGLVAFRRRGEKAIGEIDGGAIVAFAHQQRQLVVTLATLRRQRRIALAQLFNRRLGFLSQSAAGHRATQRD